MKIGIPNEIQGNETRVALVPQSIKKITQKGIEVQVESGAGEASFFSDKEYEEAGAKIIKDTDLLYSTSDLIIKVRKPEFNEIGLMKEEAALVSILQATINIDTLKKLTTKKITAFSLDSIPRITRAQSMDVLSSMSTISGYKAVLIAANHLPKFFPMLMTAAGTIAPAKVFIIGAGVAGLQAIATAKRLGAVVEAFDTRPVVKEQTESLGARFVELDLGSEKTEGEGGYAKQISKELHQKELELIGKHVKKSDVVITTAQIPGKRAPILITEAMVKEMQAGAIIVDLAVDQGGNCEVTELGKTIVKDGVTISGLLNLPSTMPNHASQMFSKNMESVIAHLVKNGQLNFDLNDEINKGALVAHKGVILQENIKHLLAGVR
ncbi:MAG: Re/Si-specific NAD(P)(+) transhydrogenase subunit alpha [Candidatus Melainabacteria bacterium]|nr:Re/Si-specific NAD(P)(+) transhydrogenase subunit alpha [Candidatus Melainabacteria bacterium]